MKFKNIIFTTMLLLVLCISLNAQDKAEYKINMSSGTLVLDGIDILEVQGYNGSEIIFSSKVDPEDDSERKRGLKVLNAIGMVDNTGLGIAVEQDGNNVVATQISHDDDVKQVYVKVPNSVSVAIRHSTHDAEHILVKDFENELVISTNHHEIELVNVTGPMAVKTLYGAIEAKFKELSQRGSVSIYSVYELVDITLPSNAKADVSLSTPYGDVYSNASIAINKKNTKQVNDKSKSDCGSCVTTCKTETIIGTINGGGVELIVKSSYEDIYLRQL